MVIEGKIALDSEKDANGNYQDKPAETLKTISFADKTEKEKEQIISNLMKSYGVDAVGGNVTSREAAVNAVQIANKSITTSNKN